MSKKRMVLDITVYNHNNLPDYLQKEAEKQGFKIEKGDVSVKTIIVGDWDYEYKFTKSLFR